MSGGVPSALLLVGKMTKGKIMKCEDCRHTPNTKDCIEASDCDCSALPYEPYVLWRLRYYIAHGGMTYRDIDIAVERGKIKQGDMPTTK